MTASRLRALTRLGSVGASAVLALTGLAGWTSMPAHAATGSEGRFTPVTPFRATGTGSPLAFGSSQTLAVKIAGIGPVPSDATAVVVNATIASASAITYLTVFPSGASRPTASSVNANPGQSVANLVQVPVGSDGYIAVYNNRGNTNVDLDIVGYFGGTNPPGAPIPSSLTSTAPTRVLDTRAAGSAPVAAGGTLRLNVAGTGPVPANATAVVLNLTGTSPTADTYLSAFPDGVERPITSNVNLPPGSTVPNLVTVGLGTGGAIDIYNNRGTTQVIADVVGYYSTSSSAALQFTGITPGRLVDTRTGLGRPAGAIGPGQSISVPAVYYGVPAAAQAVVVNVTGTGGTVGSDFVTAYPGGSTRPTASTLNVGQGQTAANLDIVKLGPNGDISLFNNAGSINLIADVIGYYSTSYGESTTPTSPPTYKPLTCSATVTNANPPRGSTEYVNVQTGAGSAAVSVVATYASSSTNGSGTSDGTGAASIGLTVPTTATVGERVAVNVTASVRGQSATCSTSFVAGQ